MIINPLKQAVPHYTGIPATDEPEVAIITSRQAPFYSWHASAFVHDHKTVLVLANDRTKTATLLIGVDDADQSQLSEQIKQAIRVAFEASDMAEADIDAYFENAGDLALGEAFDRSTLPVIKDFVSWLQANYGPGELPLDQVVNRAVIERLVSVPVLTVPSHSSKSELATAISEFS